MTNIAQGSPDGPKKIYGRTNINWQGPQKVSDLSQEAAYNASKDFDSYQQEVNSMDDVESIFGFGNPLQDGGWIIPGTANDHDFIPRGLGSEKEVEEDLDPNREGSTAWKMQQVDTPWEKYDILTSSEVFEDVMSSVKVFKESHDEHKDEFKKLQKDMESSLVEGKDFPDAGRIYDEAQQGLQDWQNHLAAKEMREVYLNLAANTLKGVADEDLEKMQRDDNEIGLQGDVHSVGEFETGSRQWLEMRQESAGGSDASAINDSGLFSRDGRKEIWESKVKDISEEDVQEQLSKQNEAMDAISRGNIMEDIIGSLYARTTGKNIVHNKSTWKSSDEMQHINLDFAEQDSQGNYLGPVEIKNVNDDSHWGEPSEGLKGVPEGYRVQALQQAHLTGASKATVVALIGGTTLKAYSEPMTDELREEAQKHAQKTRDFISQARLARKKYKETGNYTEYEEKSSFSARKGIPKYATKTKSINKDKKRLMSEMAVVAGVSQEDIAERFVSALGTTNTKEWTPEKQEEAFKKVYSSLKPHGVFNGVDLETNGMHPMKGKIIEFGGVSYDMDSGEETTRLGKLYNPGRTSMRMQSTGREDVHHISPDMVENEDELDDVRQKEILDYMTNNGPIVAHNASFEKGWLRGHIKGYAEAEARGDITYVDTMKLTSQTTNTDRNRLQDFVENYGGEYVDAHRATNDVEMMMEAFKKWGEERG